MSRHERISWVSLGVSVVISWLYFSRVWEMPVDRRLWLQTPFVASLIGLAILLAIASEIAFRIVLATGGNAVDDDVRQDERDELIGLKASRNGYRVLSTAVVLVLAQIAILEWFGFTGLREGGAQTVGEALFSGPLTPMIIWQLLLAASTLAGIAVYASRIVYYRRGG